jgi:hypothetical protein
MIAGSQDPHVPQGYADANGVKVSLGNVGHGAIVGDLGCEVFDRPLATVAKSQISPTA